MGAPLPLAPGEGATPQDDRRLTPAMSSRKLHALDFIKRYFGKWGHSPTIGEIAAELRVSRQRAHGIVHQMAVEKMIEVVAGKPRGIRLIDRAEELSETDVLLRLLADGWTVGHGDKIVVPPDSDPGPVARLSEALAQLTRTGLSELLELDHVPDPDQDGDGDR
jgi:hypothetical protein